MGFGIQRHGARARLGWHILNHAKLIRRVFMNDGHGSLAIRAESKSGFRVKASSVCAGADRQCGDDLAGVGVHDHHQLVRANRKEPPMFAIHGETTRPVARRYLPTVLDHQLVRIELNDLAGVFDVDKDVTFFVGRGELWFATEWNRTGYGSSLSINRCRVLTAAIKREHAL